MKDKSYKEYWDININKWGAFYLESSHSDEEFNSPGWLTKLYKRLIVPIEARLMGERYKLTIDFINQHVKTGMIVADIGCGTGLFTVEILKRGAKVLAIDISQSALEATRKNIAENAPEHIHDVSYLQLDVAEEKIPKVDVSIAMGVTPYVTDIESFYKNVLGSTNTFFCLVLDPRHWANRVRHAFPFLNVRNVLCFERARIDRIVSENKCKLINRRNFASGYLDIVQSDE